MRRRKRIRPRAIASKLWTTHIEVSRQASNLGYASTDSQSAQHNAVARRQKGRYRVNVAALIVAAGRGTRLGGDRPKQYIPIAGRCALRRSIERFLAHDKITTVLPVIHSDDRPLFDSATKGLQDHRFLPPVSGGQTRAETAKRGLEALGPYKPDVVLIHDAARPFVPKAVISRVIDALETVDGAFAALPVIDAMWRTDEGLAQAPVERADLWRAQTPQGFHFEKLKSAFATAPNDAADDVAVAWSAGLRVRAVLGDEASFKITFSEDLSRAKQFIELSKSEA